MMKLDQFSLLVEQIPYGKKLPTAVYLMPSDPSLLPKKLLDTIRKQMKRRRLAKSPQQELQSVRMVFSDVLMLAQKAHPPAMFGSQRRSA